MRLRSLRLENFRKFRDATIEFPDGVLGLVGRNGAGKSTILESIGWALFGHDAARTGKDLLKRRGADPKDDCRVTLAFEFGGVAYEVVRELIGKSGSHVARLTANGALVVPPGASSQREVTQYLERAFHMDAKSFFTSLVARQRELAALTDMTPGARQRVVLSMLRIDAIDDAIRAARDAKRELRARLDLLDREIVDARQIESRAASLSAERASAEESLRNLERDLAVAAAAAEEARAARDASQRKADAAGALAVAAAERRAKLEAVDRELGAARDELRRLAALAVEHESLAPKAAGLPAARAEVERVTAARQRFEDAERRRRELADAERARDEGAAALAAARAAAAERAPARKALDRVRAALPAEREALADAQRERAEAKTRADAKRAELEKLARTLANVERLGPDSPCPTCTRRIGEHYGDLVGEFARERAAMQAALDEEARKSAAAGAREAEVATRVRELSDRERELALKVQDLVKWETRATELASRYAADAERAARLADALRALAPEPVALEAVAAARAQVAELDAADRRARQLEGQLARRGDLERAVELLAERAESARAAHGESVEAARALAFDPVVHAATVKAAEAALADVNERRLRLERSHGALARVAEQELALAAERERQARLVAEATGLRSHVLLLERLAGDRDAGALADFKAALVARVRPVLSAHAGATFRDLTDGKYADLEVNEDYDLLVADDGEKFSLDRFSGGESDLANLCLRLAVSRVIAERAGGAEFQFVALDEIFGSQDEVRKGNILRALSGLATQFRQILVVTHIEDVKESCERVIRVVELPDGTSVATVE